MEEIPQPPPLPLLGNLRDIDPASPVQSFEHIATKYGPIFKLQLQGKDIIFVAGHEVFSEICDENRFQKVITDPLEQVRNGVGSGLFTAYPGEHDWEIAHRTLMPAFGPLPIQDMFGEMHDVCSQLVLKWSRLGSDEKINVTDDYTRLTLDSIALCAMDTRFNSFYHDDMHPFVQAMVDFLAESGLRANRPPVAQIFLRDANRKYKTNIETMKEVARKVIVHRRKNPSSKRDLLNAMINGRDPKTDEAMSDESIMNNMVTFLIAGHETTSGLLSFTTYYLLKNPRTFRQAQEEVDKVVGQGPVEVKHISQLHYVQACLRESIRLQPTAPAIGRSVRGTHPEPISGGRYLIPPGIDVVCLLGAIQRDPAVFGEEAGSFKPERMLEDEFRNLPSSSWKPFGTGPRACIGRPFAWQEAILALAMILQHFDLRLVNPSYELRIKQTLTTKPDGLEIYATLRDKHESGQIEKKLFGGGTTNRQRDYDIVQEIPLSSTRPITILYGSNTGTCEGIAQTLANRSVARGFMPNIALLDSAVGKLPTDQPVIVITASFEGEPADNASQFFEWIMGTSRGALDGVQYAVFGCGHHDWVTTYQRIPQLIDMKLERSGATRLVDRGESDVALGNVLDDFDSWADSKLWPVIGSSESKPGDDFSALNIEISSSARIATLKHNVHEVLVERTAVLSAPEVGEKRMVTFRLPSGTTYSTGDYLSVLPINSPQTISRVLSRFGLAWDTDVLIKPPSHTALPLNQLQPVTLLLGCYVELSSQASKKNILTLARLAEDNSIKQALEDLAADASMTKLSVLDILEMYPELPCPFAVFLSLLPSMRVRQYSIASSPLVDPHLVSITYGVIDAPIRQLPGSKHFLGAATNYMKALQPGEKAQVSVKKSHYSFHLPGDNSRPVIMICAGTGIAPFRGFVQERAVKIEAGQKLGPAVLFVGCKYKDSDRLHADEFDKWEKMGAVEMYYAFSREPEASMGCRYAQERMALEKERIFDLFARGGKVFVCGSSRLGAGVKQVTKSIFLEKSRENGEERTEQEMEDWFNGLKVQERWCSDVFD